MNELSQRISELARVPVLLVASDYDGTLAPIAADPAEVKPDREAIVALRTLASMPQTHVAVISGRSLQDLAKHTGGADLHLVGSHGSEFEESFAQLLGPETLALRERLGTELRIITSRSPDFILEEKPAAFAFHFRRAEQSVADAAVGAIMNGPALLPGVHVRHGKKVVELSVVETNKGQALEKIRQRVGASAAIFLGDDLTDEDAFAVLTGPDVGVKVGPGETKAQFRIDDCTSVARLLADLAEQRSTWLAGRDAVPIEKHSLLSDQRTIALVNPLGRIVWMCLPRIDSHAIFAEILGGPSAGFFEICPVNKEEVCHQEYVGPTMALRTQWSEFSVTNYLDCSGGRAFQRAGRTDLLRVVEGRGRCRVTFAPRLDFGRLHTRLVLHPNGVEVHGGRDPLVLHAPGIAWTLTEEGGHQTAGAEVDIPPEGLVFELRYGTGNLGESIVKEPERREETLRHWSAWAKRLSLPKETPDLVLRSALVIKALTYGPTGAIAAAATTSLPEAIGGVRNWDYRYCWPRDAALAAASLARLGSTGTAMRLLDWLLGVLDQTESPERMSPIYTVSGGNLGPEGEINVLAGYAGSRPVRVGNAAAQQIQLDVFGYIADLIALLADRACALTPDHWRLMELMVGAVSLRWSEPDHGIWEPRTPPRHHVHSKVMCWLTVDRAMHVAEYFGRRRAEWAELRSNIAEDVLRQGWRAEVNSFSAVYDAVEPDAATLWLGISGLLDPSDPRFLGTIDFVAAHLRTGPTVYRYVGADGLPGFEGGFHLCTTWLIEAYLLAGRKEEALALYQDYVALAGPTGLYSEEYDPKTKRALGNHPQAYSHLGLINAAVLLSGR